MTPDLRKLVSAARKVAAVVEEERNQRDLTLALAGMARALAAHDRAEAARAQADIVMDAEVLVPVKLYITIDEGAEQWDLVSVSVPDGTKIAAAVHDQCVANIDERASAEIERLREEE